MIADDHGIVRSAIRILLESHSSISVVAEASDGDDALRKITELSPDVALVDIGMPKLDGIEVTRRIFAMQARTRVLALTAHEDQRHVADSLRAGAAGFVPKSALASELVAAIEEVASGGNYVHPRVVETLLKPTSSTAEARSDSLSPRESQVLELISQGHSNKEVAARLEMSVKTIETYKARGMEKINAHSRVDLVRYAVSKGWLNNQANPHP